MKFNALFTAFLAAALALGVGSASLQARSARELDLRLVELELPGPPVELFVTDIDGDDIVDLLILVAYTTWDQITTSETIESDEVEGLLEMMTVVPALADRRELHLLRGLPEGGFATPGNGGSKVAVPTSVVAFFEGPPAAPILALDDEGLVAVRLASDASGAKDGNDDLVFERLLERPTVLSDVASVLPGLPLSHDLDGDGLLDVVYPLRDRLQILRGGQPGFEDPSLGLDVSHEVFLPTRDDLELSARSMHYPLPRLEDLDGDGDPDLVLAHPRRRLNDPWIAENLGGARFAALERPFKERWGAAAGDEVGRSVVYLGDVDGDGTANLVEERSRASNSERFREEMREAKNPPFHYDVIELDREARPARTTTSLDTVGYAFGADSDAEFPLPGGFVDLDGDGRQDLVTITLDFSMMQLVRIMVTQSISLGLDFHVYCQGEDGAFQRVQGLDLSGKFKIRLNDVRLGQLSQFAGDFDGDGRSDFLQLGRGRRVSIHRGEAGCRYPSRPDLTFDLRQEPRNLSLVQVRDFDGDELADLLVVQPRRGRGRTRTADRDASTLPVTLEMHLSRQGSVQ